MKWLYLFIIAYSLVWAYLLDVSLSTTIIGCILGIVILAAGHVMALKEEEE